MSHKSKGSKGHPARISGIQKKIRERLANEESVNKRDGSIKPEDIFHFKKSKKRKNPINQAIKDIINEKTS